MSKMAGFAITPYGISHEIVKDKRFEELFGISVESDLKLVGSLEL